MKLCVLLQSDFPPDIRFSKESRSLANAGHDVHLLCNNKKGFPESERWEDVSVHRLKNHRCAGQQMNTLLNIPLFFNPRWILKLFSLIRKHRFDVLHVVNLPLAPLAVIAGRVFHIPVVYDMYENYPEAIRTWKLKGLAAFIRNPRWAEILDRICIRRADYLITVVEEAKHRLMHMGVEESRIFVVHNSVDLHSFLSLPLSQEVIRRYAGNFVISYTGQFSAERGIETAIQAMPIILENIPSAKLVLVGAGPAIEWLKTKAEEEKLADRIDFVGWVDYELFPSYIQASAVCAIPHPANPFINTTIPNKLFEYMALSKPVVVSDAKPLRRIVENCRCGEVFESNSSASFAEAVLKIHRGHIDYGLNGKRMVLAMYNWDRDAEVLLKLYDSLLN